MMITNNQLQEMIDRVNRNPKFKELILSCFSGSDLAAIKDVLKDGSYERFDCYDSNVCEQFIRVFERERSNA